MKEMSRVIIELEGADLSTVQIFTVADTLEMAEGIEKSIRGALARHLKDDGKPSA